MGRIHRRGDIYCHLRHRRKFTLMLCGGFWGCNKAPGTRFGNRDDHLALLQLTGWPSRPLELTLYCFQMSYVMLHYDWFICPIDYSEDTGSFTDSCVRPASFQLQEYNLPRPLSFIFRIVSPRFWDRLSTVISSVSLLQFRLPTKVGIYPMVFHTLVMGLFASIIGPFGGFFASGFKRAFKIKDFGAVIPGHGGLMDRFDCQLLMGTFVNVYIHTFIR